MDKPAVLIAEEERIVALDLQRFLKSNNVEIFSITTSCEELISKYNFKKPDFIIVDVDLRCNNSNFHITQKILQNLKVPLIFISGFSKSDLENFVDAFSTYEILEKPIDNSQLLQIITKYSSSKP